MEVRLALVVGAIALLYGSSRLALAAGPLALSFQSLGSKSNDGSQASTVDSDLQSSRDWLRAIGTGLLIALAGSIVLVSIIALSKIDYGLRVIYGCLGLVSVLGIGSRFASAKARQVATIGMLLVVAAWAVKPHWTIVNLFAAILLVNLVITIQPPPIICIFWR